MKIRWKTAGLIIVTAAIMLGANVVGVALEGNQDRDSLPGQVPQEPPGKGPRSEAALVPDLASIASSSSLVTIGLNMKISELLVDSFSIPPDTMGAVGPDHIVEMINGNYEVRSKSTGGVQDSRSLGSFWANVAGVIIPVFNDICNPMTNLCSQSGNDCSMNGQNDCASNSTFDPRIIYDHATERFFAVSLDRTNPATGDNNILVARSDTSDPMDDWDGFLFDADTVGNAEFHDYDTLGLDADGIYSCTQDFGDGGNETCYSIPKADLLMAVPSAANLTRFEATPPGLPAVDGSWQPVLDFGASDGRAALLATSGGGMRRTNILGANAAGATLTPPSGILGDPGHAAPPPARQPHPANRTIENVAPRFVTRPFEQGDSIWAVHAVAGGFGNSALQWYEIDEPTSIVIQWGVIQDPDVDFHEPSIAVNEFGEAVIGYTCSGPNLAPSTCASVGETVGGVTTFDAPVLLKLGAGHYFRDVNGRNRWGDYSATVIDPVNHCKFWTFQEYVEVTAVGDAMVGANDGEWGIQLTEISFSEPTLTMPGDLFLDDVCVGETSTGTLEVCNTSAMMGNCDNLVIEGISSSDPDFQVTEPTSGFPIVISPDFCFPFQVTFTPSDPGPDSATLLVESNAGDQVVMVSGGGAEPRLVTLFSDNGAFGDVCLGDFRDLDLILSNSGDCNLGINNVTSSSSEFIVAEDMIFPLVIGPGDSVPVPIRFEPMGVANFGPRLGEMITIFSDDPDSPKVVPVSGNVPSGEIRVTGSPDFGQVCPGELAEKTINVCNVGPCNLEVFNALVDCPDFTLINNPFPATISHDSCLDLVVQFTPTSVGEKHCNLTITHDDPNNPPQVQQLWAETPVPMIDVPPSLTFPPTVVQDVGACSTPLPFPVSNTGICDLEIVDYETTDPFGGATIEYSLSGLPSFPIILEPGHIAGEGDLDVVFHPHPLAREVPGKVSVTYVSEPILGTTTQVDAPVCGEGVRTGARVLVTRGGVPLDLVKSIKLQRLTANRNKNRLTSIDNVRNVPKTIVPAVMPACAPIVYHREYSTVSNPIQLPPGSYQVTVTARIDGRNQRKVVGFDVSACDFNPSVVVDF